jgi:hypothetical protein
MQLVRDTLFVAGEFTHVAGTARSSFAAIDGDGKATAWDPHAHLITSDAVGPTPYVVLTIADNTVFLAGTFDSVRGQPRPGLAAVDAASGDVLPWVPAMPADTDAVFALDIKVQDGIVYLVGFALRDDATPTLALAFDATTGAQLPWQVTTDRAVASVAPAGPVVYLGGQFATVNGATRAGAAAVDARRGSLLAWDPHAGERFLGAPMLNTVVVQNGAVYVGGLFDTIGGSIANGVAALDPVTAAALAWPVELEQFATVAQLTPEADRMFLGGGFSSVNGDAALNMAAVQALK